MIDFKEFARLYLQGWCGALNIGDGPDIDDAEMFLPLVGGNADHATIMAMLSTHWQNDLEIVFANSPSIRLTTERNQDGVWEVVDVPEPPLGDGETLKDYHWVNSDQTWAGHELGVVYRAGHWEKVVTADQFPHEPRDQDDYTT